MSHIDELLEVAQLLAPHRQELLVQTAWGLLELQADVDARQGDG